MNNLGYNAQASSIDEDTNKQLASFGFNGDSYSHNYYFTVNFFQTEALTNETVDEDFVEFKNKAAALATVELIDVANTEMDEPIREEPMTE